MSSAHGLTLSPFPPSGLFSPFSSGWASSWNRDSHHFIPSKWTSNSHASCFSGIIRSQSCSFQGPSSLQVGKQSKRRAHGLTDSGWQKQNLGLRASVFPEQPTRVRPGDAAVHLFPLLSLCSLDGCARVSLNSLTVVHTEGAEWPVVFSYVALFRSLSLLTWKMGTR